MLALREPGEEVAADEPSACLRMVDGLDERVAEACAGVEAVAVAEDGRWMPKKLLAPVSATEALAFPRPFAVAAELKPSPNRPVEPEGVKEPAVPELAPPPGAAAAWLMRLRPPPPPAVEDAEEAAALGAELSFGAP